MAKREGEDGELRARLEKLGKSLEAQAERARQKKPTPGEERGSNVARALSLGTRIVSEFVAAIVVGGVIGWAIDRWLHTEPWGLVVFLMLGMAAGFWNIYRIATTPEPPEEGDSH